MTMETVGILDWYGKDQLPPNTPRCGFDGRNPICKEALVTDGELTAIVVVSVVLVTVICVALYRYIKM